MKIYKFRSLTNETEYCRLRNILETGYFWCSNFQDLNDPIEGVFSLSGKNDEIIRSGILDIYSLKNKYKICSFSGIEGFEKPSIWGYYTSGFKGVAIEIEIEENKVKKIDYKENIPEIFSREIADNAVKNILTRKLKSWESEDEYRYLIESDNNYHKIGKISAVYFGNPYGNLSNTTDIQKNKKLVEYINFRKRLTKSIDYWNVKVENGEVKKQVEIYGVNNQKNMAQNNINSTKDETNGSLVEIYPKKFIQKYLIEEIRDVVFRHPFLAFSLIAIGIEFLGKCMLIECDHWDIKREESFRPYGNGMDLLINIDSRYSELNLKDQLRNGLIHTYLPKSKIVLSEVKDGSKHLEQAGERTVLVIEILYRDFVKACHAVIEKEFDYSDKMNTPFFIENSKQIY